MTKSKLFLVMFAISSVVFWGSCDSTADDPEPEFSELANLAQELGQNADYSLFAATLANVDVKNESGYTIFALPDSIIKRDDATLPATDLMWHVVSGKFTATQLLQQQTLQTIGGQTLKVESEIMELEGKQQTLLYINGIPVNYQAVQLIGEITVYPIETNIAKINNPPSEDDLDAYNSYLARALEGKWAICKIRYHNYHIWSDGHTDKEPYEDYYGEDLHSHCYEIFKRNPEKASQGYAGTYETIHTCGTDLRYSGSNGKHAPTGWWKVSKNNIRFEGANLAQINNDNFNFDENSFAGNKLGKKLYFTSGRSEDSFYGGTDLVIVGIYRKWTYTLMKVANYNYRHRRLERTTNYLILF